MGISVVILTLNEEKNLPGCLESVRWCDDIVVFDSHSSDQTTQIADSWGARVYQREFDNYAAQRNSALRIPTYKYPWVLMLDADERVSSELADEIRKVSENHDNGFTLYRIRRKDMFMGRWLRRSSGYPTWFGRLIRVGHVTVKREINEEYHTEGNVGHLEQHLIHYPFNKGVDYWFERHNRYSSMEAKTLIGELQSGPVIKWKDLFSNDPVVRRRVHKKIAYRMPFRLFWVFCYLYFFRLGILDGRAGLTYSVLRCIYEYMIDVKFRENYFHAKETKAIGLLPVPTQHPDEV